MMSSSDLSRLEPSIAAEGQWRRPSLPKLCFPPIAADRAVHAEWPLRVELGNRVSVRVLSATRRGPDLAVRFSDVVVTLSRRSAGHNYSLRSGARADRARGSPPAECLPATRLR